MPKSKVIKVILDRAEVREQILKGPEITSACTAAANKLIGKLGSGYKTAEFEGVNRKNISVYTEEKAIMRDNYRNNTVEKALAGMIKK